MPRTRSIGWAQLKIGIVAVAAMALASMLILAVGGQGGFPWQRYPLRAEFADVQGMKTGAVVRIAGKDVGKVVAVDFDGDGIVVGLEVSQDVRPLITDRSVASIGSLSLLGEPLVDISPASQGTPLQDNATLKTTASGGGMAQTAAVAEATLEQVRSLLEGVQAGKGSMGKLVTDDALYAEFTALLEKANTVATQVSAGKGTVSALLNDPAAYVAMKASLDDLQAMTAGIRRGDGPLGRLFADEALSRSLSTTATNLETMSGQLARTDGTVGKLLNESELYDRLDGLTTRLDGLVSGLAAGQGTAGQLLQDKALYDNMNQAVISFNELIAAIKADPRKHLTVRVSIFGG
ncbi:MAG: MlaD family protein [Acidobacteria bacterium]|nr:MlaD family protein [Acidobacteriota bacterium]